MSFVTEYYQLFHEEEGDIQFIDPSGTFEQNIHRAGW